MTDRWSLLTRADHCRRLAAVARTANPSRRFDLDAAAHWISAPLSPHTAELLGILLARVPAEDLEGEGALSMPEIHSARAELAALITPIPPELL